MLYTSDFKRLVRGTTLLALVLSLPLALSSPTSAQRAGSKEDVGRHGTVDGFGRIKLGMSFDAAVAALGRSRFNPASMTKCERQMTIEGCLLFADIEPPTFATRGGIPYAIQLNFNRFARISDVGLNRRIEGSITLPQCENLVARTLDWVVEDYGLLEPAGDVGQPQSAGREAFKSPAGHRLVRGKTGDKVEMPEQLYRRSDIYLIDNQWGTKAIKFKRRSVRIGANFIEVFDKAHCSVSVEFVEPDTVERPRSLSDEALDAKLRGFEGKF